jgi:peptide deformylase
MIIDQRIPFDVVKLAAADGVRTYVNPQIVWASADMIRHEEGSVSMPGVTEEMERHARVRVSYQDLSGVEKIEEADLSALRMSPARGRSARWDLLDI